MHVLVASSGNAILEPVPTLAGHRGSLLMPTDRVEQRWAAQAEGVYGIPRWHKPSALSQPLPHLQPKAIGLALPGGAL